MEIEQSHLKEVFKRRGYGQLDSDIATVLQSTMNIQKLRMNMFMMPSKWMKTTSEIFRKKIYQVWNFYK